MMSICRTFGLPLQTTTTITWLLMLCFPNSRKPLTLNHATFVLNFPRHTLHTNACQSLTILLPIWLSILCGVWFLCKTNLSRVRRSNRNVLLLTLANCCYGFNLHDKRNFWKFLTIFARTKALYCRAQQSGIQFFARFFLWLRRCRRL